MENELVTQKISLRDNEEAALLFGPQDSYLKMIEDSFATKILARGTEITLSGKAEEVAALQSLFAVLVQLLRQGQTVRERELAYAIRLAKAGDAKELLDLFAEDIGINFRGKWIKLKTLGQREYVRAIRKHDIIFGIGPAGTGKTYLAVVMAVSALRQGQVKKIVLTRPAVEAGENLGFLPGDLQEKVDPYLRPLYDALDDVLGHENVSRSLERGIIEIAPLAYMRGRTLEDSFIILDEAQNTTPEQMKMFLTRLGFGSKMVITGDVTQIDLPRGKRSGLMEAERILHSIAEIAFVYLKDEDVVRHHLVQKIITAYQLDEQMSAK